MVTLVCKKSGGVVTFKQFFTMMEMFSHIYVIRQILQDIHPIAWDKLCSCVE